VHDQLAGHLNNPASAVASSPAPAPAKEETPLAPSVKAYQEMIIDGPLQEFLQKSKDASDVVGQHVRLSYSLHSYIAEPLLSFRRH
jgi:hypothetical protein